LGVDETCANVIGITILGECGDVYEPNETRAWLVDWLQKSYQYRLRGGATEAEPTSGPHEVLSVHNSRWRSKKR
jgi:hypothetical protein